MTRQRLDVNLDELDQMVDRSTQVPLSKAEGQKLKAAIHAMAECLSWSRSTEKTSAVLPRQEVPDKAEETVGETASAGHGRYSAAMFSGAARVAIPHAQLHSGDRCPECRRGKVYGMKEPATLVKFIGRPPLEATIYERERLRCNACGLIYQADGVDAPGPHKYDETAVAMIALLKYGTGVPFHRLERLQKQLGMPLAATTQWDLMASAAERIRPGLEELIRQAAQGGVIHNDDTGMRILRLQREPDDERTGTFTSGIVSRIGDWSIALFFTGWKHAGENLAEVLKRRARELPPLIQMSDALSRNTPKVEGIELLQANCLAHGRRQVVEVINHFPEECRYVLETLREVFRHDALARERGLSAEERLRFHQEHSKPLMEALHDWVEMQLSEHKTEPNSGLGKAITYLLNHWPKLTLFLRQAGAPLENNIAERALKKAILNRKNALFYKTPNGASVGDLFMSLIHTCELNGANPFDYLTELQRHSEELRRSPSEWMPWN